MSIKQYVTRRAVREWLESKAREIADRPGDCHDKTYDHVVVHELNLLLSNVDEIPPTFPQPSGE